MALSRIWTAFILIALLVAAGKFVFEPDQQQIFSNLVTGKNTDTISARSLDSSLIPAAVSTQLTIQKVAVFGKEKVYKTEDGNYRAYRLLSANGIFETTKDAVNLCIGLIGIMALFMGFEYRRKGRRYQVFIKNYRTIFLPHLSGSTQRPSFDGAYGNELFCKPDGA